MTEHIISFLFGLFLVVVYYKPGIISRGRDEEAAGSKGPLFILILGVLIIGINAYLILKKSGVI